MPPLIYLDNCIVSGDARKDLAPAEQAAVATLRALERNGVIELVTSRLSWHEQGRTRDPLVRAQLEAARDDTKTVAVDTRHLSGSFQSVHGGGFISTPLLTDILDDALYRDARAIGLKDIDARHLVHAHFNRCMWFVTTDPDFTRIAAQLVSRCGGMRIATPSETAQILGNA